MPPKKAVEAPPAEEASSPPPEPAAEQLDGEFLFQDGSTYSGQYQRVGEDVCLHGQGVLVTGPESFKGTFERGCYKEGKYTACSGAVYVGGFRDNLFNGFGEYHWPNGRTYKGTWKDGFMHGRGLFLNFSYGVDKLFTGFSVNGRYSSNREEQDALKRRFLEEYGGIVGRSAGAALAEAAADLKSFLVPAAPTDGEEPDAERRAALEIVDGPFPEEGATTPEALQAFAAHLEEGSERPLAINVMEERSLPTGGFDAPARLLRDQLQHAGQCVAFSLPGAEAGGLALVVLVNVSKEYDPASARWKVVHVEEGGAPSG